MPINEALLQKVDIFRPIKPNTPTGETTYTKAVLTCVKISQSSKGFSVSSTGAVQKKGAVLFFNIAKSSENPKFEPIFKAGDIVAKSSDSTTPSEQRFIVNEVTEHTFKGKLHHYEVLLQ